MELGGHKILEQRSNHIFLYALRNKDGRGERERERMENEEKQEQENCRILERKMEASRRTALVLYAFHFLVLVPHSA